MQNIINNITAGTVTNNDLVNMLVTYHDQNVADMDVACDTNDSLIELLEAANVRAASREEDINVIEAQALKAVNYAQVMENKVKNMAAENKLAKQAFNENKNLKKNKANHIKSSEALQAKIANLGKENKGLRSTIHELNSQVVKLKIASA